MNAFEDIIDTMRKEAQKGTQGVSLMLGTMTGKKTCSIGSLELDEDDLLYAEHLTQPELYKLNFTIDSSGGSSHTHTWTDKSKYLEPLKEGDIVLVARLSEEQYAIIERLVSL